MSDFSTPTSSQSSASKVLGLTTTLLFLGTELPNDHVALLSTIHRRAKERKHPLLSLFLAECTEVIRSEIALLSPSLRQLLQPWQTVPALAAQYEKVKYRPLGPAIQGALLSTLQIALIIGYHEQQELGHLFDRGSATLVGMGVGRLSAVAVSASSSLAELALGGAESVRVAFRFGVHVVKVAQYLEPRDNKSSPSSWIYAVTGLLVETVQEELDRFNQETGCPELAKVFISTLSKTSVSVSGPPSRLEKVFLTSQVLRNSRYIQLPIFGGVCHAPHLYKDSDVESILYGSDMRRSPSRQTQPNVLSTAQDTPYVALTAGELYAEVVFDILARTNFIDKLSDGVRNSLSLSSHCNFLQFRTALISNGLIAAIDDGMAEVKLTSEDLGTWLAREKSTYELESHKDAKLAIVGMSCRMPGGANDTELFWQLMMDGRDVHTEVPADRFDLATHFDASGKIPNATTTPFGNFIDNPGLFDAGFFKISPREAEQTDPMHRLALVTAYEALEMSGYAPNRTPSTTLKRVGTFYGQTSDDWREVNGGQVHGTYAVPGGVRAFANGRINYFFKFGGPSFSIDTACSSGLAAVQAACTALWAGEADMVLAGGLGVITSPENYSMLGKGYFLSQTGQCKVWDNSADGYCRGDGIGSVAIKRLEDAEADNDNIIAVISAGATNHSAEAISITHPHAGAQMDNYRQVMHAAGISPLDVGYIELHGTGTQSGDAVESESVTTVFAPSLSRRKPEQRLHLGAVKSNIGHGEAAAGIASLLKVLLVMQKGVIPPHVGIVTGINPIVARNLDQRNAGLVMESTPWPRPADDNADGRRKRYAAVNSFGAHGGNTMLLLEDAPARARVGRDPRRTHAIVLSAKSKASLRGNVEALLEFLEQRPETDLGDLSYTLCARRMHHHLRMVTVASSINELISFLGGAGGTVDSIQPVLSTPPAVAFAFTGQGVFYDGISARLCREFPFYREEVIQLDGLVQELGFPSVVPRIKGSGSDAGTEAVSAVETQLTILVVQIALSRLWQHLGVVPGVVVGHSLGEYAALVAAGVLSAVDAIFLVGRRAQLTKECCEHGNCMMLSVRAGINDIKDMAGDAPFEISCLNGPQDTVISGQRSDIEATKAILKSKGLKCVLLDLPFAFHTAQMEPILLAYEEVARHITFKAPQIPVLSPLLGDVVFEGNIINSSYLRRATREPVNFVGALKAAHKEGIVDDRTVWVDIGPHPVCSAFVRSVSSNAKVVPSLRRNEDDFTTFAGALAALHRDGVPVAWNEYFQPYERAHRLLHLPAYRWNEKNYWIQYEGTWTLDKAYPRGKSPRDLGQESTSSLRTSSVHQIISEQVVDASRARLTAQSDLWHPSLFLAMQGHLMSGYPAVTTAVWADIAYTLGEHLYRLLIPSTGDISMNVSHMDVLHAQVLPHQNTGKPHIIHITAEADLTTGVAVVCLYVSADDGTPAEEAFASTTIQYEEPESWKVEWARTEYLVKARIDHLTRQAADGSASKLSHNLVYELLRNIVDLKDDYRGMQSVVLAGNEAFANVTLSQNRLGTWHAPPHWLDSILQVAAVICNGSEAFNPREYIYVPYSWMACRMVGRLESGAQFQSYVRISPMEEPHIVGGDVYILQGESVVGLMTSLKFRRVPRILMSRFFLPSSSHGRDAEGMGPNEPKGSKPVPVRVGVKPHSPHVKIIHHDEIGFPIASSPPARSTPYAAPAATSISPVQNHSDNQAPRRLDSNNTLPRGLPSADQDKANTAVQGSDSPMIERCLQLTARETGLERSSLTDAASLVELGIDSLMSLVLSEKLRLELGLEIQGSVFLECLDVGALKEWVSECC